jgi:hypothetical protein
MEKVDKLDMAGIDMASVEQVPKGHAAAARFLRKEKDFDLIAELEGHSQEAQVYVKQGMEETFLRNIQLPQSESAMENNERAIEGLLLIKKDKNALRGIASELEHLFRYYEQALEHAYSNVKQSFTARFAQTQRALEKQIGAKVNIDVERQPGFREELLRVQGQLDAQYEAILTEQKQKIKKIP